MTTIEDKLNLFMKIVYEKVEKQSEEKQEKARKYLQELYASETKRIEEVSRVIVDERVKKAEIKSMQTISQAVREAQHSLLKKKKDLLDTTMSHLMEIAGKYTKTPEYQKFLHHAIRKALSGMTEEENIVLYFTQQDLDHYGLLIQEVIKDSLHQKKVEVTVGAANKRIIGGCLCQNEQCTRRMDCSMASQLEDQRDLIGQIVMEHLNLTGGDNHGKQSSGHYFSH